jgi:nucleotide-binding universal stress UspA family protein
METAISLADLEKADLKVLHVWDLPIQEHAGGSLGKNELKALSESLRKDSELKMDKLVGEYSHVPLQDHLLHGKPHKIIRKFVDDKSIDLLIMGTVARPGIPGFMVGNTAERILNHVNCSVLALKPSGWKSPIK